MPLLTDLPVEVLLDHLLPQLRLQDLFALSATNHAFQELCDDNTFWKKKCADDFNFSSARTARNSGWKFIYKGLSKPKIYVWGSSDNERLGLPSSSLPRPSAGRVPFPVQLKIPGTRIVELVAGGWSFNAIDHKGDVYVWGTLDGTMYALRSDGFSIPQAVAPFPLRLELPHPVTTLSCGRLHSMALDSRNNIWTFISWGRPFRLITPAFDSSVLSSKVMQVECGWSYSAALTADGRAHVWWPFGETIQRVFATENAEMDKDPTTNAHPTSEGTIPCVLWDLHTNPIRLPPIPSIPTLGEATTPKIIKIAAMDNFLIGLTDVGHVLKFGDLSNEESTSTGRWTYLPHFSEIEKVRQHPVFGRQPESSLLQLAKPTDLKITHITANFEHFVAYSTGKNSLVLRGSVASDETSQAEIVPELQYNSIISVVLGDYHSAALSADGRLYTWGAFSLGALGLGDPKDIPVGEPGGFATQERRRAALQGVRGGRVPDVKIPTEVRFDHGGRRRETFCFAAAAAGWHTGALVIELEDNKEDEEDEFNTHSEDAHENQSAESHDVPDPSPVMHGPGTMPMYPTHAIPFVRIGFAGRGRGRASINNFGRARGRGSGPGE